jgi:hypothetical protein
MQLLACMLFGPALVLEVLVATCCLPLLQLLALVALRHLLLLRLL